MKTPLKPYLLLAIGLIFLYSCQDEVTDEDLLQAQREKAELEAKNQTKRDSLDFILSLKELDYQRYVDSLKRADSVSYINGFQLPYTYNVQIYDGTNTSISGRTSALDAEVTVSIIQYGQERSVTTRNGLATFNNIGMGVIQGNISGEGYTTLQWSVDNTVDPRDENVIDSDQYLDFLTERSFGTNFAIFATQGENVFTMTGRATVESDLTNNTSERVPEGTTFLAYIDVDNPIFRTTFIEGSNEDLNLIPLTSYGYSPVMKAQTDAQGNYTFTLPASPQGLPMRFEYSDVVLDQTYFSYTNGDITEQTISTVFSPQDAGYSPVPVVPSSSVVFEAGGGAEISASISGSGSVESVNLISGGQNYQGVPRVIFSAPNLANGVRAQATATVDNGIVTGINITEAGTGYTSNPTVTITEGSGAQASVASLRVTQEAGGVADVVITSAGTSYSTPPNVVFYYDNNPSNGRLDEGEEIVDGNPFSFTDAPEATAILNNVGSISNVSITNSGGGLNTPPLVAITTGVGGLAEVASVDGTGAITSINITDDGAFYSVEPAINISTVTGADADLEAVLSNGEISSVTIVNGGANYQVGDVITFVPEDNSAEGAVVWEGLLVNDVEIDNIGNTQADGLYYNVAPNVVFSEPDYRGTGSMRAQGTAVLGNDGRVIGITVTDPGFGYINTPSIQLISGTGATATANIDAQKISGFNITNAGSGYILPPTLQIIDQSGTGSGATAEAVITNGRVTSVNITDAGAGYTNPEVIVLDPGTAYDPATKSRSADPAVARVEVTEGVITEIEIIDAGSNYNAAPKVLISSPIGNGFEGTAQVANGRITAVDIVDGGVGYAQGNTPGAKQNFSGPSTYNTVSGITRVIDIRYGTGEQRE